jgi:alkylation response protein AidB-like acyl-CoA dehydrogenase
MYYLYYLGAVMSVLPLTCLSEDEKIFKEMVSSFAQENIKPLVKKMDEEAKFDKELIKKFFEQGFMGIEIPEEFGGSGSTFFNSILLVEEFSKVDPSAGVLVDVQNTLVNNAIIRWGSDELKKKYLTKLSQESVGSYALSESGSGSDAFALSCKAEDKGDCYLLNGRKLWITNANESDIFIVFANINKDLGYKGITAFVVERGFKGFQVGKKEDKLGIRASSTCELILEDCIVPKENVLGEVGKGYKVAIETLNEGRIGIGAQMIGLAQGSLEYGIKYSKERVQFGKPISSFQAIQFQLAELSTQIEAAKLMVYNAARMKDAKMDFLKEAAMAKYFSSQVAEKVASTVIEIYGGNGFIKEFPVEKYYRDSKIGKIYEGTSFMQLQTIAKVILKD